MMRKLCISLGSTQLILKELNISKFTDIICCRQDSDYDGERYDADNDDDYGDDEDKEDNNDGDDDSVNGDDYGLNDIQKLSH